MAKSADAFRTISEVAEWLGSPAHVLRFWESKFTQVKPVKRAGGRRYYRPADMKLLGGIKTLLHDEGMTIKGVQKILREQGVKHVSSLSQPLDLETVALEQSTRTPTSEPIKQAPVETAQVVQFQRADTTEPSAIEDAEAPPASAVESQSPNPAADVTPEAPPTEPGAPDPISAEPASDTRVFEDFAAPSAADSDHYSAAEHHETSVDPATADDDADQQEPAEQSSDATPSEPPAPATELPAFLHRSSPAAAQDTDLPAADDSPQDSAESIAAPAPAAPEPPRPARVDVPADPLDSDISAPPGILTRLAHRKGAVPSSADLAELAALRAKLAKLQAQLTEASTE